MRKGSVLLPAAVAAAMLCAGCGDQKSAPEAIRPVRTAVVGDAAAGARKVYTGTLAAHTYVNAAFEVPGRILRRYCAAGDRVKAGDKLAELDPVLYRDQLKAANADVGNARAQLKQAEQAHERAETLVKIKAVSEQQREAAERALLGARAQLDAALSTAHRASEQMSYTVLRAKRTGQVTERFFEAGEVVAAGQPVYRIAGEGAQDAVFSVPDSELKAFSKGAAVTVCPLGKPAECRRAAVTEIAPEANALTRTFQVKARLEQPGAMALGTTLECSLAVDGEPGFRIPSGALTRTVDGRDAVWRFDPATGQVSLAPVEIRSYATGDVLVARGVEPGMRIVTAGVHVLREGQKVKELESAAP